MKSSNYIRRHQLVLVLVSFFSAGSIVFLVYVQYFQTYGFSPKRILVGLFVLIALLFIFYFTAFRIFDKSYKRDGIPLPSTIKFWMSISLLFSPHILPLPHYPASPIFQPESEVEIRFNFVEASGELVQLKGVWLSFNDKKFSVSDFVHSDAWIESSGRFFIDPREQGNLVWRGKIGERAKLIIFPLDAPAEVIVLWDGELSTKVLKDDPVSFSKKSATPLGYYFSITIARVIVMGFILSLFFGWFALLHAPAQRIGFISATLLVMSLFLVNAHFNSADITDKLDLQVAYHETVLAGDAPSPWQYRLFSEWILEGLIHLAGMFNSVNSFYIAALILRVGQNILIYFLAFLYFRKLGYSQETALIGILFLSGSLLNSFYKSGFSFNTYFDLVFYLGAGLLILRRSFFWLPFVMVVAALNRETSGLIPIMALSAIADIKNWKAGFFQILFSFFCWLVIFVVLRLMYSGAELFIPYENPPGIPLMLFNLRPEWFTPLLKFFGAVPLFGLTTIKRWTPLLVRFFVLMVPIWFGIHLIASVIAESRLFLVPQTLIFIPVFLLFIDSLKKTAYVELGTDGTLTGYG